jgi:hypothetical protein
MYVADNGNYHIQVFFMDLTCYQMNNYSVHVSIRAFRSTFPYSLHVDGAVVDYCIWAS